MRLVSLNLARYGKFTDVVLDFGEKQRGNPDFHIVYGPNEAGKTTALAGFLDLVYGISKGSKYDFKHKDAIAVGGVLQFAGGATREFLRIKKTTNSLLDPGGNVVSDTAILGDLEGLARADYQMKFSLDAERLKDGGLDILKSKGDLGQLLFAASASVAGLSEKLNQLNSECEAIYKKRGQKTDIAELKKELVNLAAEKIRLDMAWKAYTKIAAERDECAKLYEKARGEKKEAQIAVSAIDRLETTVPRLSTLEKINGKLVDLADAPADQPELKEDVATLRANELLLEGEMKAAVAAIETLEEELGNRKINWVATNVNEFRRKKWPTLRRTAMRWKITIEGLDEFSGHDSAEMVIEKRFSRLSEGEIGLSISDGKSIMALLQQLIVKQQCEAYVLTSRYCTDCQTFRRIKDYGKRKIRTVYGPVEVSNPRIMNCRRCVPYFCDASAALRDICPDQATPELMELSARMGSLMPYRKAADVLAEFLPIPSTESFMTLRHRTMKLGERLDEKAREREWFEPPSSSEHKQAELDLPNDPEREFVVSIDTAHVRCSRLEKARTFEIAVARCGRGRRGSPPGHYFATADTSKRELRSRALQALQHEGYVGRGEVTVISDGAEILKRLPKALPKPTAHIIDWFHIAMKVQPLQQVADHLDRTRASGNGRAILIGDEIRSVKWKLWHGQTDRAIDRLEKIVADLTIQRSHADATDKRLLDLVQPLLTYVRSNQNAIVNYGARYRSGRRIASSLAESAVDSLVARRMVKKQQMQWSLKGAHRMLQVRAAVLNGDLRERLAWQPPEPTHRHHLAWMFEPTPPLLRAA